MILAYWIPAPAKGERNKAWKDAIEDVREGSPCFKETILCVMEEAGLPKSEEGVRPLWDLSIRDEDKGKGILVRLFLSHSLTGKQMGKAIKGFLAILEWEARHGLPRPILLVPGDKAPESIQSPEAIK